MREAVICEPIRTPVGGYGGSLRDVPVADLAATVMKALVARTGVKSEDIDDVIFGQVYPNSEAPAIGRIAALDAGLDISVPGTQIDRRCGSGLQAVINASMCVQTGVADLIVAGGAESMSQAEYYTMGARWGLKGRDASLMCRIGRGRVTSGGKFYPVAGGMLETAENLRRDFSISREEQDAFAANSHAKASAATAAGKFADETVPVTIKSRKGETVFDTDEHIRHDATPESLSQLRAILGKSDPESTVTAGNASGQNDAAAACIVTTREKAEALGLKPLGRLVNWGVAGVGPERMGIGPVPAVEKAFSRAGLAMKDMDLVELNEAFAAQVLACTKSWGFGEDDYARLNVNGSGISLGHPVGATGVRILATMLREMERREARYGLETMCIGGGQGLAAIFERVS
ncbi:MAG: acetyl-CoA C-acyltransferase [Rhodobacteraceae bacterium]|jgi:acetyl-CoA C-acetyltransferase|uniref:Acetyl-CoA C-acetyltransferase n=1 Tax=Salipiger profundus TaxID=1229727 RepID=A0A1U7DA41_9RHOB|nr:MULTISPECIES: acetyl-CoA C-acetyltransferase [Salipiger]APX24978.1 acetyl-CoA C-acetyltransferase [Salipiger profundus]MAB07891.1 acetyl-CoA C-acyltransferase [Paracoccaceae bacterium]GFZ99306.1 acetyl-CoA acetyltransferase [Salipiger profundus]SFC93392.1 acetyl-CoA C-acetyltransferase [Salipiger profundus]